MIKLIKRFPFILSADVQVYQVDDESYYVELVINDRIVGRSDPTKSYKTETDAIASAKANFNLIQEY